MDLTGRTCIVTGVNTWLGFGVARRLGARGADTTLLCRSPRRGEGAVLRIRAALLIFAVLSPLGCDSADRGFRQVESWDSAGVTIVSNPDIALPEWTIDSMPFVDIGTADGRDGQDLALPWSSVRLADGRIAISNAQSNELRFYTPEGRFIRSVGREGEGPGEFQLIALLRLGRGDTIISSDAILPRLTLFSSDGAYARTIQLEALEGRVPRLRGLISDTVALFSVQLYERSGGRSQAARDTLLLATRGLEGGVTQLIGRFPADEKFNQVLPNGSIAAWNQPFARDAYAAVAGGLVWVGVSDTYEVRGFGPNGDLRSVVRMDRPAQPVGQTERSRFFQHHLEGVEDEDQRRTYENVHQIIEFPETLPAYSALESDDGGFLWVEEYVLPWEGGRPQWRIFDSNGRAVAVARTPAGLLVQEIGRDYVMGLWRDPMDIEHVRLYRLTRGTS